MIQIVEYFGPDHNCFLLLFIQDRQLAQLLNLT